MAATKDAITRQRLLEAAGEVFARSGFRSATVREICEAANANVAAVNYHFRDKAGLYSEVLRFAHMCALDKYPPDGGAVGADPAERLRAFIRAFLQRVLDEGRPAWHGKLIAREIAEPTKALDDLVRETIIPQWELLSRILVDLLGKAATPARIRLGGMSVVGQCLHYYHARAVIDRLTGMTRPDLNEISNHITAFSLAGILGSSQPEGAPPHNGRTQASGKRGARR